MSRAAIGFSAAIVSAQLLAADAVQQKPVPTPAPTEPPAFTVAWQKPATFSGPATLAVGGRAVILASPESGITAFAVEDGRELWNSSAKPDVTPVTAGSLVFCLSANVLEALNQETGQRVWQVNLGEGGGSKWLDAGDQLITVAGSREMRAWRTDGSPAWRSALESAPVAGAFFSGDVVLVALEKAIVALEALSGAVRWRGPVRTRPLSLAVRGDDLFFGGADGAAYSFQIVPSFDRNWRHRAVATIGAPSANEKLAFFTFVDNTLRAFSRGGGTRRWTSRLASRPLTGPLQVGNTLVVALANGTLAQVSAETGQAARAASKPDQAAGRASVATASPTGPSVFAIVGGDGTSQLVAWRLSGKPPRP